MVTSNIDSKNLLQALGQFPKNIQKNVMRGAIRAGANIVRDRAKELVPVDKGDLKKTIGVVQRKAPANQYVFSITNRKGLKVKGWYAHFVEFGTVKQAAQPFMRPAFEQSESNVLSTAKEYIVKRIPAEVAKAKR